MSCLWLCVYCFALDWCENTVIPQPFFCHYVSSVFKSSCVHSVGESLKCIVCFFDRETPKASSCWTTCVTTTTSWRRTTLGSDMWTLKNREWVHNSKTNNRQWVYYLFVFLYNLQLHWVYNVTQYKYKDTHRFKVKPLIHLINLKIQCNEIKRGQTQEVDAALESVW